VTVLVNDSSDPTDDSKYFLHCVIPLSLSDRRKSFAIITVITASERPSCFLSARRQSADTILSRVDQRGAAKRKVLDGAVRNSSCGYLLLESMANRIDLSPRLLWNLARNLDICAQSSLTGRERERERECARILVIINRPSIFRRRSLYAAIRPTYRHNFKARPISISDFN